MGVISSRRRGAPTPPPAPTWAEVLAGFSPIYNFPLNEASGNFANIGSRAGSVPLGFAQGTPAYQAGSFINPATGIGVQSGDGFDYASDPATGGVTVVLLIKPPASLVNVNLVTSGGGALILRCLSDGRLRMSDTLGAITVSSSTGVLKANQYNLVFFQPLLDGAADAALIYHTSVMDGGTVTEVASGIPFSTQMETSTSVIGSSNGDTAIIEAFAVIQGALDLSQMQALADTLTWS